MSEDVPGEVAELEQAADWRIKKLGADPADRQSAAAAELLQKLASDVRGLIGSPVHTEYVAVLNWLGEFDVMDEFMQRAHEYRAAIGATAFPRSGEDYLRTLIDIAKDTAGV